MLFEGDWRVGRGMRALVAIVGALAVQGAVAGGLGLLGASSWVSGVEVAASLVERDIAPAAVLEVRSVPELVRAVYDALGAELSAADEARLGLQVAALDPRVGETLQQLLGAVEFGLRSWQGGEMPDAAAARIMGAVALSEPLLGAAASDLRSVDAQLFPGPNSGLLFNDPFNLILVGAPGPSVFRGNTWPWPAELDSTETLLTIDFDGDDTYYNHAGAAHPLPDWVCGAVQCNGGFPVGVSLDFQGNDKYLPSYLPGSSVGGALGEGFNSGLGLLVDLGGDDLYVGETSQGEGDYHGMGLLIETAGNDQYFTYSGQGNALDRGSVGILLDIAGSDSYSAGSWSQGTGGYGGSGALLDLGGADRYFADGSSRGFVFGPYDPMGIFLDACGLDTYLGGSWGVPGGNDQMWQQGPTGFGIDQAIAC
jgi:hypothetical protein